jgi:hypothetical protein
VPANKSKQNKLLAHLKKLLKMNNNNKTEKEFDTVKFFREVKTKIAKETEGMTFAELKEYLNNRTIKKEQIIPIS